MYTAHAVIPYDLKQKKPPGINPDERHEVIKLRSSSQCFTVFCMKGQVLDRGCYGLRGRTKRHFVFLIKIARADEYVDLLNSGNPFVTLSENERLKAFVDVLSSVYAESPGYIREKAA